jgi:hypothetical protein
MRVGRVWRALLAVLGCVLVATSVNASSTTIAADFTITADQTTVGLTVGAEAVLLVDVSPVGSWVGPVSLAVAGGPVGVTTNILPNPVLPGVPAVIAIIASSNTPLGSYTLIITATSGHTVHSITVIIVISLPTGFTMHLSPPVQTVQDGSSTDYALSIHRGLLTGPISLKLSGVPQFATGTIKPSFTLLGSSATVHVDVGINVVPGVYKLTVSGSALLAAASASAYLIVTPQVFPNFPISGNLDRNLAPGVTGLLNLALTNPFSSAMSVTALGVTVAGTTHPGCAASNFAPTQYTGSFPLVVPANSTRTLQQLGVPSSAWPKLTLLNLPVNQDVCQNAQVTLQYSGTGSGS